MVDETNFCCRMIAVMTMNVGYFLSVLGGVFLGSFAFGNWTGAAAVH
jgi:solute carrier family 31 (copper transporter), member 1